jgi:hypothetical protein
VVAGREARHLLVHRDGFEREALVAVVFGDAAVAGDGLMLLFDARVEVAERVERGEVCGVVLDDAPVLLDGGRNPPLCEGLLGRADGFCFVESHRKKSAAEKPTERNRRKAWRAETMCYSARRVRLLWLTLVSERRAVLYTNTRSRRVSTSPSGSVYKH